RLMIPSPPSSPLFPYTTLFRSSPSPAADRPLSPRADDHVGDVAEGLLGRFRPCIARRETEAEREPPRRVAERIRPRPRAAREGQLGIRIDAERIVLAQPQHPPL